MSVGQHLEELLELYECLPRRVDRVLEIGTEHGGWLLMLASVLEASAEMCAVDQEHHPEFDVARDEIEYLGHSLFHIRGSSADAVRQVEAWLGGGPLDVLHLDGPHTYEGVRQGWNDYAPLVRPGGIVVIHDVEPTGPHAIFGAQQLFREREKDHRTQLCHMKWQEGLGIGIVFVD